MKFSDKITVVIFAFMFPLPTMAQRDSLSLNHHEISFSINTPSIVSVLHHRYDYGCDSSDPIDIPLHVQMRYMYNISKHFAVGGLMGYETIRNNESLFYVNAALRLYWFNNKHFGMYSMGCIGPTVAKDFHDTKYTIFPSIVPIGADFGSRKLSGFVEVIGFGIVGIVAGGIKYSF